MSKPKPDVTSLVNELHGASAFFRQPVPPVTKSAETEQALPDSKLKVTSEVTQKPTQERRSSSIKSREIPRSDRRVLPTRDEIQEFSFKLRDEFKVKVQAEVPHQWQDELEDVARQLKVKKLELYRYILGEFLGKVKRKDSA